MTTTRKVKAKGPKIGRPVNPDSLKSAITLRCSDQERADYDALGGVAWFRKTLKAHAAKLHK